MGRRGQRVPRLPGRHLGLQRRPLPPGVVEAIARAGGAADARRNLFYTEPAARLAERLARVARSAARVFLCNSGAEANEAAIKLARKRRRGGEIVVLEGAFHGRTMGALSATPQEAKQAPFAPLVPGFVAVAARRPEALGAAVSERTAAVMLEPIQGETGIWPISDEMLAAAREACDRVGALLIFDEIQCGHGAHRHAVGLRADAASCPTRMTVAKALGGGLPIGALHHRRSGSPTCSQPGDHGSTFAGGPVVAAAALATLDVIDDDALLARVRELGAPAARRAAPSCRA